jgi:hypothetical protein
VGLAIHPFHVETSEQTFVSGSLNLKHVHFGVKSIERKGLGISKVTKIW